MAGPWGHPLTSRMSWQQPSSPGAPWTKESKTRTPNSGKGQGGVRSTQGDLPDSPRTIPVLALLVPHSWKPHVLADWDCWSPGSTGDLLEWEGPPSPQAFPGCPWMGSAGGGAEPVARSPSGWRVRDQRHKGQEPNSGTEIKAWRRPGPERAAGAKMGMGTGFSLAERGGSFRVKKCKSRCCQSGSALR